MNEPDMNRPSVTELYRRFADKAGADKFDVANAEQLAAQVASSPARAQLLDFSRDLEPESAALSARLALAFNEASEATHRRHGSSRRIAGGSRRWRGVAAALSAALVAAVVVWGGHHGNLPTRATVTPIANTSAPDRIFAALSEGTVATSEHRGSGDQIFRGEFRSDEIFSSSARNNDG
jgi:hypothetical protein